MYYDNGLEDAMHMDFETYCELDVRLVGAPKYSEHPSCDVLILCYSFGSSDDAPVYDWVPLRHGRAIPKRVCNYIENTDGPIVAHNAQFEMFIWENVMVKKYGAPKVARRRWRCTAAMAAAAGLPRSLDGVGVALKLPIQKDKEGSKLIQVFCKPRKPTKKNPNTRIMPDDEPEKFGRFIEYCRFDVRTERQVAHTIPTLSDDEWRTFMLDINMNSRGLPIDMRGLRCGLNVLDKLERRLVDQVSEITGGIRPAQRDKMLEFIQEMGVDVDNLQAKTIKDLLLLKGNDMDETARKLLRLRVEGGKASTKKLKKILQVISKDGRCRGCFLYYGAHTGRWSGKLIQPQNFIRGEYSIVGLEAVFDILYEESIELIDLFWEYPIDALAQAMRGYIQAHEGRKLVVCDFSAVEARVLAWLANEKRILELYEQNADLYVELATRLYNKPADQVKKLAESMYREYKGIVTKNERKLSKDIYLGSGFQLSGPGFYRNCLQRGIVVTEEFSNKAIAMYREGVPKIVQFWGDTERCAIEAVEDRATETKPVQLRLVEFYVDDIWLCIRLPSGRVLRYAYPKVTLEYPWEGFTEAVRKAFGKKDGGRGPVPSRRRPAKFRTIKFFWEDDEFIIVTSKGERNYTSFPGAYCEKVEGIEAKKLTFWTGDSKGRWVKENTYGGKLVENITQAVARDFMVHACHNAEKRGYQVIGTVHDELITEVDEDFGSKEELEDIMRQKPKWGRGAPINAEGWCGRRYRK